MCLGKSLLPGAAPCDPVPQPAKKAPRVGFVTTAVFFGKTRGSAGKCLKKRLTRQGPEDRRRVQGVAGAFATLPPKTRENHISESLRSGFVDFGADKIVSMYARGLPAGRHGDRQV